MTSFTDIDFAARYRDDLRRTGRRERTPEYWNDRAAGMSERVFDGPYVRQFVARMDLSDCATLLDVGCGPGTIGLSVASRLEHVYGLDYSPGMLAAFVDNARRRGLTRVTPILRDWDSDWSDVPACDIVVASRSTAVPDLEATLVKLDSKARQRVYVTYPAGGHFVGDDVCEAIGRPSRTLPDYLYVVGILHHLGIHPTLDYLPGENRLANCGDFAAFLVKVTDLLGELTVEENERLCAYYEANRHRIGQEPMRWALFSWEVRGRPFRPCDR
jgi:SAM-dependent methyltransferase